MNGNTFHKASEIAIPAAATENELPLLMLTGCPVHVPHIHRSGEPASSHSSSPTIDQVPPEPFVQDAVDEFDVAAAEAAENVMTVPPAV